MKICSTIFIVKNNFKISDIKAVAFDIDGTLYRTWKLNLRMSLHFLRHSIFFLHYGIARKELRKLPADKNFINLQNQIMARRLHCTEEEAHKKLDKIVYTGLKKYFPHIKPCKDVVELIQKLKEKGYKIALLSDFPPSQKGDIWGILEYCDVVLGSEEVGALKPAKESFEALVEALGLPAEQILYVGNSHKYDVEGSKKAGLKSAWLISEISDLFGKKSDLAEITFSRYSQLEKIIFNES